MNDQRSKAMNTTNTTEGLDMNALTSGRNEVIFHSQGLIPGNH